VPWIGDETLREIRCEQYERMIGADNCVRIARMFVSLQKLR
jgi:hypothetical protein